MDRRSRSNQHRYSRSHSRSRERSREKNSRRRGTRSRSRERNSSTHYRHGLSNDSDLYRDIVNDDYDNYQDEKSYSSRAHDNRQNHNRDNDDYNEDRDRFWNDRSRDKGRDYDRDHRDRDYERERDRSDRNERKDYRSNRHGNNSGSGSNGSGGSGSIGGGGGASGNNNRRYSSVERDRDGQSDEDSDDYYNSHFYNKTPSKTVIVIGLLSHITEADITGSLIQMNMTASAIRLIRKRYTGASRGFAFVEFNTVDEAAHWMDLTKGTLLLPDQSRAALQYSHSLYMGKAKQNVTDWFCEKCGVFNFKRRDNCFKCYASREESKRGGDGSHEVSNILTKKIMLRNLDALTNEEGVLIAMQQYVPDLAKKINKILISRDPLTQTSRGVCYLNFESLVDSMYLHNELNALDPPLQIDNREVIVNYCIDHENRQIVPKKPNESSSTAGNSPNLGSLSSAEGVASVSTTGQYSLADVPRLAEYSASIYASTPVEHAHYLQYYTQYYISEINKGQFGNLPTDLPETSANSGAAVALSAIQRKQKKMESIVTTATAAAAAAKSAINAQTTSIPTPTGNDGKTYQTPDVSLYQYDETSGYYYDPITGLYYDAHSQYYYNTETGAYLYWDQRNSTYVLATPAAAAATVKEVLKQDNTEMKTAPTTVEDETKKEKKEGAKHDKVKVAKKIVKDMEKWAKQLNQKKDYTVVATPQPILTSKSEDSLSKSQTSNTGGLSSSGYADVGFSILEKKERNKLTDYVSSSAIGANKQLISAYGSDSDDDHVAASSSTSALKNTAASSDANEKDYVDFQKLTCLLCKRAFQSLEILQKHLKMSNLHKENLQKYNLSHSSVEMDSTAATLAYRDRAKERRQKYGETGPPPPNRSRERFEKEIKSLTSRKPEAPTMPISSNNVGNRLLQKMGWSEGQGLGRKNQGRTNIIEAEARSTTAGLGTKSGFAPGDDYKTYIKKMMKSRYESV